MLEVRSCPEIVIHIGIYAVQREMQRMKLPFYIK